jgi:hypothetical protein
MRVIKAIAWALVWLALSLSVLWAAGALYFDFPVSILRGPTALLLLLALVATAIFVRGRLLKLAICLGGLALVTGWWLTIKPTNNRTWQPDVAHTAWAEINGDQVTVHNVRNCEYRTEDDFTARWDTRTVRLSQITGMDLAITYWGSPWMAHPIVSFHFADALPLCFSIETRKSVGQNYSALRGLYRQYTLIYIVADERDSIRVRSNYRHGEDVYLYRTLASPPEARARFLEYIQTINILRDHPRWYNAITTNCTTSIRTQRPRNERAPWDWRILLNGKGDELLYERHLIATGGLPFSELKQRSYINKLARAADQDPAFSRLIRANLPRTD